MEYSINYISKEVLDLCSAGNFYIKYPGSCYDRENLTYLLSSDKHFNVLLHGIAPSTGSIMDPQLLSDFDSYIPFIKKTNQRWLSYHFDYKEKFCTKTPLKTLEENLGKIRSAFPNMKILFENMCGGNENEQWSIVPENFTSAINKYGALMLLDVSHARIASQKLGMSLTDYVDSFDLSKVEEIHISGVDVDGNGMLYDKHTTISDSDLQCLAYVYPKCENLKMISLEYTPRTNAPGDIKTARALYESEMEQLGRVQALIEKLNAKEHEGFCQEE